MRSGARIWYELSPCSERRIEKAFCENHSKLLQGGEPWAYLDGGQRLLLEQVFDAIAGEGIPLLEHEPARVVDRPLGVAIVGPYVGAPGCICGRTSLAYVVAVYAAAYTAMEGVRLEGSDLDPVNVGRLSQ